MELGTYGVFINPLTMDGEGVAAARLVEDLGFGTLWLAGSPPLPSTRELLGATDRLSVATAIVNIWHQTPAVLAAEYVALAQDFSDRLLVGLGVGHPESVPQYERPLGAMQDFLDGLDAAPDPIPPAQRCLAALGPKMLELSAQRTRGAAPLHLTTVEHTRFARERVGPHALVAPDMACVLDTDVDRARATARKLAVVPLSHYMSRRNYTNNLRRYGFGDDDFANGGSDRLVDALIPHGTVDDVAAAARAHLQAGADHVCLQPLGEEGIPRRSWTALAQALINGGG